jgi:hypothetical protein
MDAFDEDLLEAEAAAAGEVKRRGRKRKGSGSGGDDPNRRRRRAIAIAIKQRKRWPYSDYGTAHYKRGSRASLAKFGPSWRKASRYQRFNRKQLGFVGRGRYNRYRGSGLYGGAHRVYGRGGFWSDLWGNIKTPLLDAAQAGLTAYNPSLGKMAGVLRKATGIGAYDVATNDLIGGASNTFEAPSFGPISDTGEISITHREFVSDVYAPSSGQFSNTTYPLNPGMEQTFKWLSQIACNYEEYEIKQLIFTFKTTVSDFQTSTGVVGQILVTPQYNLDNEPFTDKEAMMTYHGGASSKLSGNLLCGVECDPAKLAGAPGKYVRFQGLEQGQDIKEFDLGRLNVAMVDVPSPLFNQAVGELWVSYTVVLRRPKVVSGQGEALSMDRFAVGTPITTDSPFVSTADLVSADREMWDTTAQRNLIAPQNSIGTSLVCDASTAITLGGNSVNIPIYPAGWDSIFYSYIAAAPASSKVIRSLALVFPADYTGSVEINYSIRGAAVVSGSPVQQPFGANRFWIAKSGNVRLVNDLLIGAVPPAGFAQQDGSQGVTYQMGTVVNSGAPAPNDGYISPSWNCRIRIHVDSATGGVDNRLLFGADFVNPDTGGSTRAISILNGDLIVTEFNDNFRKSNSDVRPPWQYASTGALVLLQQP